MNPGHNIDRVLDAFRNATPPAGMERRILNTLEIEAHRPTVSMRSRRKVRMTTATCCSALVVAALIGAFILRRHSAPVISTSSMRPAQPSETSRSPLTTTKMPETAPTLRPRSSAVHRSIEPRRVEAAQADDIQISHPAPPIPLTEQERILLHYARRGNTGDLAQISNDRKAAKEEQDAAEFQAFFAPPPIKIGESE